MTRKIIHVVDDDESFRNAVGRLLQILDFEVTLFDSAEAFLRSNRGTADCLLLDMRMPGFDGLELQAELQRRLNAVPVIFVTAHADVRASVTAIKAGAEDFLIKPVSSDELIAAIKRALARSDAIRLDAESNASKLTRYQRLTRREREVLTGLVRGLRNKQIAAELGTTERTIKAHRSRVMHKLEVQSVAELVVLTESIKKMPSHSDPLPPRIPNPYSQVMHRAI
jgi:FixJ family two-component response regulator